MAPQIVSWEENGHSTTSVLSRRTSSVSTDTHDGSLSLSAFETPCDAGSLAKSTMSPLVIGPGGGRTPRDFYPGTDGPLVRHEKYFFNDGNITFLVRGLASGLGLGPSSPHGRFIYWSAGRRHALLHPSIFLRSRFGIFLLFICPAQYP
jgi:hypothetical protein